MTRLRHIALFLVMTLALAACTGGTGTVELADPIPSIDGAQALELIATANQPIVLNIWASWCVPCRSEAPLLREASMRLGDQVRFIGVDVQDSQNSARAFLAEFGITFENYFDPRRSVPQALGGRGVPITYFFASDGSLVETQIGVIDERTLALQIDEIIRR